MTPDQETNAERQIAQPGDGILVRVITTGEEFMLSASPALARIASGECEQVWP